MSDKSRIEWTERTWSPITGCTKVSQGCKNCYAEREVETRWSKNPKSIWFGRKFTDIQCHPEQLDAPMRWKTPSRIFVCPRSDLFHESVPDEFIDRVFAVMALAKQHVFQVLTKRPERMLDYLSVAESEDSDWLERICDHAVRISGSPCSASFIEDIDWPIHNIWLGVSIEDQPTADERIPLLLQTPAAVRWVSAEPLLGPVSINQYLPDLCFSDIKIRRSANKKPHLDWLVVGGESGPNARPMHPDWPRSLRDQCVNVGVPFFFKQWGEWLHYSQIPKGWSRKTEPLHAWGNGGVSYRIGKKAAGRMLDGRTWDQYPGGSNAAAV